MRTIRYLLALLLVVGGLAVTACSPEALRARNGGPGGDVGNWGAPVDIHGKTDPNYGVPKSGEAIKK